MSSNLLTVLQIGVVGATMLFGMLGAVVGLMYLLTAGRIDGAAKGKARGRQPEASIAGSEKDEHARRGLAAALAVAAARADVDTSVRSMTEAPSNWRLLHRTRQLTQPGNRRSTS